MSTVSSSLLLTEQLPRLREQFGSSLKEGVSMAHFTTAHVGGQAEAMLVANSAAELEQTIRRLWDLQVPFILLGSGSNVLVSDQGLPALVVLNRARRIVIDVDAEPHSVWAESGANFGSIARQAALRGLSGLEWAATIPGTLGGAVYGNAGAFGGDIAGNLMLANILHPTGKETWSADQMQYAYRSSLLKRSQMPAVVLSARLRLQPGDQQQVQAQMAANSAYRRRSQPPGASMGSMFKNPPGDHAGRLIEAAGLKGKRVGDAEISPIHANFFINHGQATASQIGQLIRMARETVLEKFGVLLELEVELLGEWPGIQKNA